MYNSSVPGMSKTYSRDLLLKKLNELGSELGAVGRVAEMET